MKRTPVFRFMPDEGCSASPKCTLCPLPECTWSPNADRRLAAVRGAVAFRRAEAMRLRHLGLPMAEIAAALNRSARTASRYVTGA